MSGTVQDAQTEQFSIGRLASKQFAAQHIGRIDSRLKTHDVAQVSLSLNGMDPVSLSRQTQQMLQINNPQLSGTFPADQGLFS